MELIQKNISDLVFDPVNARKHPVKNIEAIKSSLTKFGQQKPIVINAKGIVIAGNGTLMAAKDLGWKSISCVVSELDDLNQMAFALADNRTSELAEWDKEILEQQLAQLELNDFDIDGIGFEDFELPSDKEGNDGLTDPDDVPEVAQNVFGVKRGDIWLLGNHRLMCGDSTNEDDVKKLMNGQKADMVFTDPPYGMNLDTDYTSLKSKRVANKFERVANKFERVANDDKEFDPSIHFKHFDYVKEQFWFGANYYCQKISELKLGSWIVWDKRVTENLDEMYGSSFELCWSKNPHKQEIARVTWAGCFGHNKTDDGNKKVHPTMKPIKLIEWFFERFKGDLVIDLFLGSGSTLIACEKTGRTCYGMELDEHYCSVIIKRWQDFTGKQAVREG